MTKNARYGLGIVAIVAAAVVATMATRRTPPSEPAPVSSFNPVTPDAGAAASGPRVSPLVASAMDAGITPQEMRNWHTRLDTDLCPKAGEQINKLEGRAPTDPKALNTVSLCLQYGNLAWYKCLLEATSFSEGKTCNQRFLGPPPP